MSTLSSPPRLSGTAESQIEQLRKYLLQLTEKLNVDLESIGAEEVWKASQTAMERAGKEKAGSTAATLYNNLRSLIIKTGSGMAGEDNEFTKTFSSRYVAVSDFGKYTENMENEITANSDGITQLYRYTSGIRSNFGDFDAAASVYIKTGLLYYDGSGLPVYGVGVGNISTTLTPVGNTQETVIDRSNLLATYTADRISFWENSLEVMYISAGELYMPSAHITGGSMNINGKFIVDASGNMTAANAVINGGTLNINNKFTVDVNGNMAATNVALSGSITNQDTDSGYTWRSALGSSGLKFDLLNVSTWVNFLELSAAYSSENGKVDPHLTMSRGYIQIGTLGSMVKITNEGITTPSLSISGALTLSGSLHCSGLDCNSLIVNDETYADMEATDSNGTTVYILGHY